MHGSQTMSWNERLSPKHTRDPLSAVSVVRPTGLHAGSTLSWDVTPGSEQIFATGECDGQGESYTLHGPHETFSRHALLFEA